MKLSSIDESRASIQQIRLEKKVNIHSHWTVELELIDWSYLVVLQKSVNSQVTLEDDTTLLACGVVTGVNVDFQPHRRKVLLHLSSLSCEFDLTKETRVFHHQEQGWKEIFSYLSEKSQPDFSVEMDQNVPDKVFDDSNKQGILVQHEETDFQFLMKIAEKLGLYLFVKDANKKSCGLYLGASISSTSESMERTDFLSLSQSMTREATTLHGKSERYFPFGSTVDLEGFTYTVIEITTTYENHVTTYDYVFYHKLEQKTSVYHETTIVHLGLCQVLSNEDPERLGRIQVACISMEESKPEQPVWISYIPELTEKDKGSICLPDPEEQVYVLLRGTVAYALGCVRGVEIQKEIDVTAHRTLYFRDVKWMVTEEKLEISYENTRTEWTASQIACESKSILSTAEDTLALQGKTITEKAEDTLALQGKTITEKAEDTLALQGKTVTEKADSTLSLESNTVNIKSTTVNTDTSKFNIK